MDNYLKRTWAVVNLDNLHYNITAIKSQLPAHTKTMAVVKADGYGHGDVAIASELQECGIDFFAVSNLDEAISLRNGGIKGNIIILGFTPTCMAETLVRYDITQTVFSSEYAQLLNDACFKLNIKAKVHLKIDTGMGRIGFIESTAHSASEEILTIIKSLTSLNIEGIFTHLSSADSLDTESIKYTKLQQSRFDKVVEEIEKSGYQFKYVHLQNSAGIAYLKHTHYDYARAGIIIYGVAPSNEKLSFEVRPLMELKSVVSMVKTLDKDRAISYGRTFMTDREMRIATVPIGYADGYSRSLSNKGEMLIRGKRAKIIGNICMDQLMLDVTDIPNVKMGDTVTVVGRDQDEVITFDDLANLTGTISYELMCLIGKRVPRVYVKENKTVGIVDYIKGNNNC